MPSRYLCNLKQFLLYLKKLIFSEFFRYIEKFIFIACSFFSHFHDGSVCQGEREKGVTNQLWEMNSKISMTYLSKPCLIRCCQLGQESQEQCKLLVWGKGAKLQQPLQK